MTDKFCIIINTTSDKAEAASIASALLDLKLCACVQIFPIESFYRWKGEVENSQEYLLFIKTKKGFYEDIEIKIRELHSYDIPEIIMIDIDKGLPEYLNWIDMETKKPLK